MPQFICRKLSHPLCSQLFLPIFKSGPWILKCCQFCHKVQSYLGNAMVAITVCTIMEIYLKVTQKQLKNSKSLNKIPKKKS